jgi:spermidine synthase
VTDCIFLESPDDDEIAAITALYRAAGWWGDGPDDADHSERIVSGSHCFVLASENGAAVGMGRAISDRVSDAYVQDVFVLPAHRRRGVATAVVSAIARRLEEDGLRWIGVVAEPGSRGLYERLGFAPMPGAEPLLWRG